MSAAPPILALAGLAKRFHGETREALQPLTASLPAGLFLGLVGPDGAGKTTLLRLIAGLLKPTAGRVTIAGLDPTKDSARTREIVGYMPQKFGLYEDLSVIENLTLHADLRQVVGDARTKSFADLLRFTDLDRFQSRRAGALSGGMKQKLGLACALLAKPKLLLLDEPSVGVDPISRRELWRMVQDLVAEGMAVIWSTAYLDEAEHCQSVLLLNHGELLFSGPPGELTQRAHDRTFRLTGLVGQRRRTLAKLLDDAHVSDGVIEGAALRVVLREGAKQDDLRPLLPDSAVIDPVAPRFEDAFIDLLGGGPGGTSVLATRMAEKQPDQNQPMVEARHLTKRFGDFVATSDVSFTIRPGEIFGLLGPNGAGKSTTFKMMCGLLRPTDGEALVTGLSLEHAGGRARQRIGYMAQKFSLYGSLSVGQNLDFFAGVYGLTGPAKRDRIKLMVELFELEPRLNASPDSLPLGFKQRLALACAVMHEPDILFLDEPTSGVDPVTRREFWTHIYGLTAKGVTIMVTTHFMDEAEYCDRIGLISHGELIALGPPDDLKKNAVTPEQPHPSMEDAFIELITRRRKERERSAA